MTETQKANSNRLCVTIHYKSLCADVYENSHKSKFAKRTSYYDFLVRSFAGFAVEEQRACTTLFKKVFVKHFCARMDPTCICLNAYSKNSVFAAKHLQDPKQ